MDLSDENITLRFVLCDGTAKTCSFSEVYLKELSQMLKAAVEASVDDGSRTVELNFEGTFSPDAKYAESLFQKQSNPLEWRPYQEKAIEFFVWWLNHYSGPGGVGRAMTDIRAKEIQSYDVRMEMNSYEVGDRWIQLSPVVLILLINLSNKCGIDALLNQGCMALACYMKNKSLAEIEQTVYTEVPFVAKGRPDPQLRHTTDLYGVEGRSFFATVERNPEIHFPTV
jgi:hypothetical protein